ncbi:UDP-N-acetylglucosamine 4,6-dehydratase (inverting) [Candidatus Pelagibacter ubique]|nr:UDP-N-acetylglucosamine 4,6-dehydratase (inverting) [Candidatus Pelagibacter ubique]
MKKFNKSILITGGTGSFGNALIEYLFKYYNLSKRVVIFSRDELKQFDMQKKFSPTKYPFLRYFIGDIRDKERLMTAMEGIDLVIHAAALKQVPTAEYNPMEAIKTNIIGTQNVIDSSIYNSVEKSILLSTDKASSPVNLYGATKLCADKLFISANKIVGSKKSSFSVVRYGNVMGSRGSVIPVFKEQSKKGILQLTNKKMTRFNITLKESVELVITAINESVGGEIFVPKIPSYRLIDLAKAIDNKSKIVEKGIREGEKKHEELISQSDSAYTLDLKKYFIIMPFDKELQNKIINKKKYKDKKIKIFSYNSRDNSDFLTVEKIKKILKNHNKI